MQWYYASNGQRQGPVTETEFERLVREGVIRPDTLVWRQGMPEWVPYSQGAPTSPAIPVSPGMGGVMTDDTAICAVSGKRYPKREMIQYEGKWVSAEHRDAFFQRIREGVAQPHEFHFAGFWIRFVATIVDSVALYAVFFATGLLLGTRFMGSSSMVNGSVDFAAILLQQGLLTLLNMGLALLYEWFFVSRFQATPGKMVMGLKIVRSDGSRLSNGRIIGRYFAKSLSFLVLCIGYIMVAFDDEKRALHDQICDTRVIKAK